MVREIGLVEGEYIGNIGAVIYLSNDIGLESIVEHAKEHWYKRKMICVLLGRNPSIVVVKPKIGSWLNPNQVILRMCGVWNINQAALRTDGRNGSLFDKADLMKLFYDRAGEDV